MNILYTLDEAGNPRPEPDGCKWAEWMHENAAQRVLLFTRVEFPNRVADVSTVFLGINCGWFVDSPPFIWETMVFSPDKGLEVMRRYTNRESAKRGHSEIIAELAHKVLDEALGDAAKKFQDSRGDS